jgi:TRL-like protein family
MKLKLAATALSLLASSGCAMANGGTTFATGTIYSGYKSGGQLGTAQVGKTGEACVSSILGAIAMGDASIETAKKAGGITQVAHVDHEQFSVLGVYATSCTIVHGQ